MTPQLFHFVHVVGLIILFAGFGSLLSGDDRARRTGGMLHGIGLVILIVAAFGFIGIANKNAVEKISYGSVYVIVKLVIWLALGFLPVLAKKKVMARGTVLMLAILLGAAAAYIGYFKPLSMQ